MIHSIEASDDRFKALTFQPGLNILIAEQLEGSADTDTRNGVGKSSLIALLHFLLGGNAGPTSIFRNDALIGWTFKMTLDVGGARTSVERSGSQPSVFLVDTTLLPATATLLEESTEHQLNQTDWTELLWRHWFGLSGEPAAPTCRSLLSYFLRRVDGGGFHDPIKHTYQQNPGDYQTAVSFLLGLDWQHAAAWQEVRLKEKRVNALSAAFRDGHLGVSNVDSVAKLRTAVSIAEAKVAALRSNIDEFRVIDSFSELEREASELSSTIRGLADENAMDAALIGQLRATYEDETPPAPDDLAVMYLAAGVELGDLLRRRFDEVAKFHESVVQNRALHLAKELNDAEDRVRARDGERRKLDVRRADLLRTLRSGGALQELTGLQEELARQQAQLQDLRNSFRTADEIAAGKAGLKKERQTLLVELQEDQRERDSQLSRLIARFETFSARLYDERVGSLQIGASANGPIFSIEIDAGKSRGINNMQVFCFDLLISELCAQRGIGPGFLVHDSHLFDGVDERQIGRALALADEVASAQGFQYIVTMNSDDKPTTIPEGFSLESHVLPVQLTDADEDGGLFGLRFH